jgi:glycosyltransferase involved in cell wall biosynthesis
MRELVEQRHAATRALLGEVDHIVAVCEWVCGVLIRNGVLANKITLCRQGIGGGEDGARSKEQGAPKGSSEQRAGGREQAAREHEAVPEKFTQERPLRLVYLGRLDQTKGVHVLIEALRLDKSLPVMLDIYGTTQGESGAAYEARVKKLAGDDRRIGFCSPAPANQVVRTLRQYDMLAVPSQWLETGPLVVLEAFAAGIPVLGSDLGGIAELITNGENGFLVHAHRRSAWLTPLRTIVTDPSMLARIQPGKLPSMSDVATTMIAVYRRLVRSASEAARAG